MSVASVPISVASIAVSISLGISGPLAEVPVSTIPGISVSVGTVSGVGIGSISAVSVVGTGISLRSGNGNSLGLGIGGPSIAAVGLRLGQSHAENGKEDLNKVKETVKMIYFKQNKRVRKKILPHRF